MSHGLLALPWLLGLLPDAPEGLPNNIIHPTRLMGIASAEATSGG
jgi:hypothetical protein